MSESNRVQKYTLLCLRVAAECRSLAEDVPTPELGRASFIWPAYGRSLRISPRGDTNAHARKLPQERLRLFPFSLVRPRS
jgi:hypothetical protein